MEYINLTLENLAAEHICCAIADKKHQCGVDVKKQWLADRIKEGHTFRKLNERGKVFIEYAPLEKAWVPVEGKNYFFIYCLWVAGSFKGKGIGKELLEYCISDAKEKGKSGVCVICGKTKKPFLSDKAFMTRFGFTPVDCADDFELLSLSFDGTQPHFTDGAKRQTIDSKNLTIYYGLQCPYIPNCILEIENCCKANAIPLDLVKVDTLEKAKSVPCVFNNWAMFFKGKYLTNHLLNETSLKKLLL